MRTPKSWRAALVLAAAAVGAAAFAPVPRGQAQTLYPYIYGVSNTGETCGGGCYSGPHAGQYLCCRITQLLPNG
jgi:hypothetical protein